MKLIAKIVSIILHPLLIPTYGVFLGLNYTYLILRPEPLRWKILLSAFLITALVPALGIGALLFFGSASDADLKNKEERVLPYIMSILSMILCAYVLYKFKMSVWLYTSFVGGAISLAIALVINFFWKISAHMVGIGGLAGAIFGTAFCFMPFSLFSLAGVLMLAGLLGTSRIILERHTPGQVYAGFLLGFFVLFVSIVFNFGF